MRVFLLSFLFSIITANAQDSSRFKDEIDGIQRKYDTLWDASKKTVVFTGSSSIRVWKDLEKRFPNHHIINSGFGGSQASDLLAFSNELILNFKPTKVFIYEGDNDISSGKTSKKIISTTKKLIEQIKGNNPKTKIILIAAKPSIARWNLKGKYKRLNRKFNRLSKKDTMLDFADVWKPMLNKRKVKQDIFVEDGLHMNAKGYEIWYGVLKPFMD
ncbi:MAG: GDSL-type esterase/lipase family protein [Flavobacteriaceae bacterium]